MKKLTTHITLIAVLTLITLTIGFAGWPAQGPRGAGFINELREGLSARLSAGLPGRKAAVKNAAVVAEASLKPVEQVPKGLQRNDWNSIRSAYQKHRHAVVAVAGGQQARNPGQQWRTRFDGRGFAVMPDQGAWQWGLKLDSYGFAAAPRAISRKARVTTDGQRVAYKWDETLEEWYVNDQRGLEHGFTLRTRPAQAAGAAAGPLELRLRVRGDLRAQVTADGQGVSFVQPGCGAVINYSGLKAWDADGKTVAAQFAPVDGAGDTLRLTVEESGARYPLTIDPIAQQAYLKASNTEANDGFGTSVAMAGSTVVVGANLEDSNATGVSGNEADNSAGGSGAAYVFSLCPTTLTINNLGDAADATPGDGVCATAGGVCTLRAAIQEANAIGTTCSPLTINFSVTGTIDLATALPDLNHPNLTINNGADPTQLTVRRNAASNFRLFTIASGRIVTINGLTMRDGDVGASGSGGGLYNNNGTLTLNDCVVSNNTAGTTGAGISVFSGTTTINRSTIADNTLVTGTSTIINGAGMFINQGRVTLNATTFSGNRKNDAFPTSIQGAALSMSGATVTATNCTFSHNTGRQTIINSSSSQSGSLTLLNCTVSNNTLNSTGVAFGAVETVGTSAVTTATTLVKNTIVAGNTGNGTAFRTAASFSTLTSQGNNLCSDATLTPTASGDLTNTNPLLAALGNYGGLTQTHALLPGSPALNAGNNTGAPTTDQRGIARPQQPTVDIGAFESRGFTLALNSGNNQSTIINTAFANPLKVNLTPNSAGEPVDGGQITFTRPVSGATATLATSPATIASGMAMVTATANTTVGGPYNVAASALGAPDSINFALTNNAAPTVVSISRGNASPTNAASVTFTVTFSESVTGTGAASNFTLVPGGSVSGAMITGVIGSGLTRTVTVNTGTGSGTLGLNMTSSTGLADDNGAALGNLPFTTGQIYTIDKTAPDTTISANPTNPSNSANASFSFTGMDTGGAGLASFECRLDGSSFSACTSPQAYTGLADGPHTFDVRALDAVGNIDPTPASFTWTIDTIRPNAPVVVTPANSSSTNNTLPTITGTAEPNSTVTVFIDGTSVGTAPVDGSGNWTKTLTTPLSLSSHTVKAQATDAAGNTSPDSNTNTFTLFGCPTQFTVNDLGDAADVTPGDYLCATAGGLCTLRAAIQEANAIGATCSPLTINFSVTGVINLATALPILNHPNLTIIGPGANQLDVHRNVTDQFRIFTVNSGKIVNLSGLTVSNGDHPSQAGGIQNSGTLTMTNCVVSGNRAVAQGGGLQNDGVLTLAGCTVSGNSAPNGTGGGLVVFGTSTTLTNCTFSGNQAGNAGGGIDIGSGGLLLMTNCTVTNNTAAFNGGGISIFDFGNTPLNATLKNTIIAGNSVPSGTSHNVFTSVNFQTGSTNNLFGTGNSGGLTNGVNGNQLNVANALLAPLGNYGGTTPTHALLPGSPALNAGNNTGAPATDQRGITRPQQTTTDIGAYESRGFTLAVNSGSPQSTFINAAFANPLKVNVTPIGAGEPVDGGKITFTPPSMGASATLATSPATIASGMASVTATANATTGGPYNVVASALGAPASVNFALTNNPQPTISINDRTLAEGNTGTTAFQFTVSLSGASTQTITVSAASANGTATTADGDYAALAATTITFNPGETSKTVTVNVNGDVMVEGNETFFVNLSGATNATIADNQGLGTITNEDLPPFMVEIGDPLLCLSAGGLVGVTATVTNPNAAPVNAAFTATLPTTLNGLPGTGLSSIMPGAVNVTASAVTWVGTIPGNTTVTITYKAQVVAGTPANQPICIDSEVIFNGGPKATVQECKVLNCPTSGVVKVSGQKPGSVLVFPYYISKAAEKKDTRLTISNVSDKPITAHVFFIDGATCQQADQFLCLTPFASFSFKASEQDPEAVGWLLVVAVDANGRPAQLNGLIGNAFVNDGDYVDNYGAEAFKANSTLLASVTADTATLFFDNQSYDAVPNQLAAEIQSPLDAPNQRVITVGLQGDLTRSTLTGAAQIGTGLIINGNEKPTGSFVSWLNGGCQAQATINASSPRVPGTLGGMIPKGHVGTMQFKIGAGVGLLMTPRTAVWPGIRTLHKTGSTTTTLTIPFLLPAC